MILAAALRSAEVFGGNLHDALALVTEEFGININSTDDEGNTFFHTHHPRRPFRGEWDKRLTTQLAKAITLGFDLNRRNPQGRTILHREALVSRESEYKYLQLVLKESQLDIDARDKLGQTPLVSKIKWLSEQNTLEKMDEWDDDALIAEYAFGLTRYKVLPATFVKNTFENLIAFLDFGADRWLKDAEGWTAVDLALEVHKTRCSGNADDYMFPEAIREERNLWSQVTDILANYSTVPVDARKVKWPDEVEP
ncbi:hypothetical protein ACHAPJ_012976 [Fusarium lateritium]